MVPRNVRVQRASNTSLAYFSLHRKSDISRSRIMLSSSSMVPWFSADDHGLLGSGHVNMGQMLQNQTGRKQVLALHISLGQTGCFFPFAKPGVFGVPGIFDLLRHGSSHYETFPVPPGRELLFV